ncbi:hypothetical protein C8T65DRAFT_182457 [Cerioporus squamosus]|nr:hypothetical protein C8T65DRAFT_182457 [Cerioporus squamosus]
MRCRMSQRSYTRRHCSVDCADKISVVSLAHQRVTEDWWALVGSSALRLILACRSRAFTFMSKIRSGGWAFSAASAFRCCRLQRPGRPQVVSVAPQGHLSVCCSCDRYNRHLKSQDHPEHPCFSLHGTTLTLDMSWRHFARSPGRLTLAHTPQRICHGGHRVYPWSVRRSAPKHHCAEPARDPCEPTRVLGWRAHQSMFSSLRYDIARRKL